MFRNYLQDIFGMNIFDFVNKNHLETQDRLEYSTPDKLNITLIEKNNINIFKWCIRTAKISMYLQEK